jgi:hypothetical protein
MLMIDENKALRGVSDAWPSVLSLDEGKYFLRMQVQ